MAVTKGHGNPNWTKEETILALDLYFKVGGSIKSKHERLVEELSNLLRLAPIHEGKKKNDKFRNVEGVGFKIQNLRAAATGKGLNNLSKIDRQVWEEFGHNPELVANLAKEIRSDIDFVLKSKDEEGSQDYLDREYIEGDIKHKAHRYRERSPDLRKDLLKIRKKLGTLHCDICGFDAKSIPKELRDAAFEAHHVEPLSYSKSAKLTRLSDMSLLCATCHRLIHRLMRAESSNVEIIEAQKILGFN